MDRFTSEKRSSIMSRVTDRDTGPEKAVRSTLHGLGFRYRLHVPKLPGKPDIVLPRHHKIIFVHGCFWHGHTGCQRATRPASNIEFWNRKLDKNIARDAKAQEDLRKLGWQVLTIWQCEIKNTDELKDRLADFIMKDEENTK